VRFFTCSRRRRALISASAAARRAADTSGALAPASAPPSPDTDDEFEPLASAPLTTKLLKFEAKSALSLRSIDDSSEARVCRRFDEVLTAPDMELAWSMATSAAHRQKFGDHAKQAIMSHPSKYRQFTESISQIKYQYRTERFELRRIAKSPKRIRIHEIPDVALRCIKHTNRQILRYVMKSGEIHAINTQEHIDMRHSIKQLRKLRAHRTRFVQEATLSMP
jgi:hypothetical protein